MAVPKVRMRGIRASMPAGFILGRAGKGRGDVQLLSLSDLARAGVATTSALAAVSSGSGGTGGTEAPFSAPPTVASSAWTNQNFGAGTTLTDFGSPQNGIQLREAPASFGNTNILRAALRPIVSAHWDIKARVRRHTGMTQYMVWGLCLRETSTSKSMLFGFDWEAGGLGGVKMNNDTSYNAYVSFMGNGYRQDIWLRLVYDGTNAFFYVSDDGVYWSLQYTSAGATFRFLTTAASHYGIGINVNNSGFGGTAQDMSLLSWTEASLP